MTTERRFVRVLCVSTAPGLRFAVRVDAASRAPRQNLIRHVEREMDVSTVGQSF